MRTSILLSFLALSLASSAAALGQAVDADELFRQGREAMETGDHARALALLRASHAVAPGRGKLLNIALCEEKVGHLVAAAQMLREVREKLPEGDDRLPIVEAHLASLSKRIPRLVLEIAADVPPEAEVALDGEVLPRAALAVELPVDPGRHVITVKAPGRVARPHEIVIEEGRHAALRVTVGPIDSAAPTVLPAPTSPPRAPWPVGKIAGIAVAGAGLLTAGAGAALGAVAIAKKDASDRTCSAGGCDAEGFALRKESISAATASTASFIAAGVALAGGAALFLTAPRGAPGPRPASVARLVVSAGGLSVVVPW